MVFGFGDPMAERRNPPPLNPEALLQERQLKEIDRLPAEFRIGGDFQRQRPVPMPNGPTRAKWYEKDSYGTLPPPMATLNPPIGSRALPASTAPVRYNRSHPPSHMTTFNIGVLATLVIIAVILAVKK